MTGRRGTSVSSLTPKLCAFIRLLTEMAERLRLLADLVFITVQDPAEWQYDWDIDKARYIDLLHSFDVHRNARELAAFVGVQSIEA
jgi:hypothetical protein